MHAITMQFWEKGNVNVISNGGKSNGGKLKYRYACAVPNMKKYMKHM